MSAAIGRSLELYYIDGRPDGMLTAELFNWTGHVLMAPRTQIAAALRRTEAGHAGVYLLLGEQGGQPHAYVGESEDIATRIRQHDAAKDWWTSTVLVTTTGNKLNKAHVRYLEARLIEEARSIGRVLLDNGTNPSRPSLSEADVAKMEAFLDNLLVVLPAVRVDMFIQRTRAAMITSPAISAAQPEVASAAKISKEQDTSVRFLLDLPKHDLQATARLQDGEFIVEAGSMARSRWEGVAGQTASYAPLHEELVRSGVLTMQGDRRVFAQDYAFRSPSAAAAVVTGRSTSGPTAWRVQGQDMTYKDWEARQLAATGTDAA